jgi:hypothetical protein
MLIFIVVKEVHPENIPLNQPAPTFVIFNVGVDVNEVHPENIAEQEL